MSDPLTMSLDEAIKARKKVEKTGKKGVKKVIRKNGIKKIPRNTETGARKKIVPLSIADKDLLPEEQTTPANRAPAIRKAIRRTGIQRSPTIVKPKISTTNTSTEGKRRLRVSNLDFNITHKDLMELFTKFGSLTKNQIEFDDLGRSRGNAIIEYEKPESAAKAIDEYNGATLDGKNLTVEYDSRKVPGIRKTITKLEIRRVDNRENRDSIRPRNRNFERRDRNRDRDNRERFNKDRRQNRGPNRDRNRGGNRGGNRRNQNNRRNFKNQRDQVQ